MMHEEPVGHDPATTVAIPGSAPDRERHAPACEPRRYTAPRLERLGEWSALTLQQSVPIGPGNF